MSSVTRFIRQIQPDNAFYSAATVVTNANTVAFEFIPSAGNTVGNYPPGYMATGVSALTSLIGQAAAAGPVVLRDMGKTIQAPYTSISGPVAFFRQVQLISLLSSAVGGVQGGMNVPDANTDYLTFYIPITVGGSALPSGLSPPLTSIPLYSACHM